MASAAARQIARDDMNAFERTKVLLGRFYRPLP